MEFTEDRRTYIFPDNQSLIVEKVRELQVSDSGNHRLTTESGKLYIVKPNWLAISIVSKKGWEA